MLGLHGHGVVYARRSQPCLYRPTAQAALHGTAQRKYEQPKASAGLNSCSFSHFSPVLNRAIEGGAVLLLEGLGEDLDDMVEAVLGATTFR